jgi:hypothetical protein
MKECQELQICNLRTEHVMPKASDFLRVRGKWGYTTDSTVENITNRKQEAIIQRVIKTTEPCTATTSSSNLASQASMLPICPEQILDQEGGLDKRLGPKTDMYKHGS